MMRGVLIAAAWVLTGAAVCAGLFWALLQTPESTIFTLGASAMLALLIYVVAAVTWGGVLLGWARGWTSLPGRAALAGVGVCLPPLLMAALTWWLVGRGLAWVETHSGEISAWFIATLDWADVTAGLQGVRYLGEWVRAVVVPFLALTWCAELLRRGWRPLLDAEPARHALSPLRLLTATAIAVLTLWAPLYYGLYWMPAGLPPTWVEPAVAAIKLGAMALVGAVGLALIGRLAVRVIR
jgi:hypothetical protein